MEEMQNKAVVFFVFYMWSTVEIFRWVEIPGCCLSVSASRVALFLRELLSSSFALTRSRFHVRRVPAASVYSAEVRQFFFFKAAIGFVPAWALGSRTDAEE